MTERNLCQLLSAELMDAVTAKGAIAIDAPVTGAVDGAGVSLQMDGGLLPHWEK